MNESSEKKVPKDLELMRGLFSDKAIMAFFEKWRKAQTDPDYRELAKRDPHELLPRIFSGRTDKATMGFIEAFWKEYFETAIQ